MKIVIVAIISAVSMSSAAFAEQVKRPLTLPECIGLARQHSGTLAAQNERRNVAARRLTQARGGMLPSVAFIYQKTYRDTADGLYSTDLTDSKFSLTQPLFYGTRKFSSFSISGNDLRKEELNTETVDRLVRASATQAFYLLAQVDSDIANIGATKGAMQERLKELQERVRLGKSRNSETLMLESQIATLTAQEEKSRSDRAKAAEQLAVLIGADPDSIAASDDTSPPDTLDPVASYMDKLKNRSDLAAAAKDVESQKLKLRAARGALLPTLDLNGAYYTQKSGSSYADSKWDAALVLNAPLFQGGSLWGKASEEAARLREYEANYGQAMRDAASQLRIFYKSAASSIKQSAAYKDAYDKANKSYQMQLSDYRYGLVSNLDVIQSMLSMLDVKKNYDRAIIQSKIDKALLDIAAGKE